MSRKSGHTLSLFIKLFMKRISYYSLIFFAAALVVVSCKNQSKSAGENRLEQVERFQAQLVHDDTTTVLRLCDNAMDMLMNKQYDEVIASLYEYTDSTKEAKPISRETAAKYLRKFKMFPVVRYERKYYSFQLEGCNDVKYNVIFASGEAAGTSSPAIIGYMFNPVKVDGEWRLCVKTPSDFYDMNMQ